MGRALLLALLVLGPRAQAAATVPEIRRHPLAIGVYEDGRWSVTSPVGGPLDTLTLAQVWYDPAGVRRLGQQDRGAWALLGAQVAAGLALGVGAIAAFDEADHYLPKREGYAVSRRDYRHRADYLYAREQADLAYAAALAAIPEAHRMKAENQAWTGFTLAFSATLVVGLAPAHRLRIQEVRRAPDRFYARDDAQRRLDAWNEAHPAGGVASPPPPPVAWPRQIPCTGTAVRGLEAW